MNDNSNAAAENADNMSQNHDELIDVGPNDTTSDFTDTESVGSEIPDEVSRLKAEILELKDKHLRMVAEFDNFRRRTAKERIEMTATASKDVLQSLLVVLDDVDRASKQLDTTTDIKIMKEGVTLVFSKFRHIMLQKGLKVMEAQNEEFNPDLHEAITEIPAPNDKMVGKIMDVVEAGYYLNDKLIRHAKVVVGK